MEGVQPVECPDGQEWTPSGKTCAGLTEPDPSEDIPGCHCPQGKYWNEFTKACVEGDQCGCVVDNKYYEKGTTNPRDCSK